MKTKLTILLLFLLSFQIGKSQFTVFFTADYTSICVGINVNFTSFSSPTSATSWYWDFGDGDTSNIQNPIHAYNSPGSYDVTLIASDGLNSDTLTNVSYINVYSNLTVDFTYSINGSTVNFFDQAAFAVVLWFWDLGNGTTSQAQNPTATYPYPPDSCYDVTLTVINSVGCQDSITKTICITSIEELEAKHIKIYPTPITGNQLTISGELKDVTNVVCYDILGNEVKIPILFKTEKEINLATNQLKKGSYFIKLLFENDAPITKTIIVQ